MKINIREWNSMSVKERLQEISKHVSVAFANYLKEVNTNEKR